MSDEMTEEERKKYLDQVQRIGIQPWDVSTPATPLMQISPISSEGVSHPPLPPPDSTSEIPNFSMNVSGMPARSVPPPAPHPYFDRYAKEVESQPKQEDYQKVGWMRRLAAITSGLGAGIQHPGTGADVAQHILREPYEQAAERWKSKLSTIAPLVTAEREYGNQALRAEEVGTQAYKTEIDRVMAEAKMQAQQSNTAYKDKQLAELERWHKELTNVHKIQADKLSDTQFLYKKFLENEAEFQRFNSEWKRGNQIPFDEFVRRNNVKVQGQKDVAAFAAGERRNTAEFGEQLRQGRPLAPAQVQALYGDMAKDPRFMPFFDIDKSKTSGQSIIRGIKSRDKIPQAQWPLYDMMLRHIATKSGQASSSFRKEE